MTYHELDLSSSPGLSCYAVVGLVSGVASEAVRCWNVGLLGPCRAGIGTEDAAAAGASEVMLLSAMWLHSWPCQDSLLLLRYPVG